MIFIEKSLQQKRFKTKFIETESTHINENILKFVS